MRHVRIVIAAALLCVLPLLGIEPAGIQWSEKDGKYVQEASTILAHCLEKSMGVKPALQSEKGSPSIRLAVEPKEGEDPESFRIEFPSKGKILIVGRSPLAVRHGACEFLERFYGVRWLLPLEDGEYIPQNVRPVFPDKTIVMTPHFRIRTFSMTKKSIPEREWVGHNKGIFSFDLRTLPNRPWFHHNLWRLLPQEEYTKSHPEFFPQRETGGPRFMPEKGQNVYWQYCFTAPGIREAFLKAIQEDIRRHPEITSVSLGVNDGGRYCQCEACLKVDAPQGKDSMGYEIRSLSFLECMDAVVRQCQAPGRTFGFLAYHNLRTPPEGRTFHPSLVPFLTYERDYWADPRLMADDQKLTLAWKQACGSVGWYDYLEYKHFLIPKISLNALPAALKWGAANGVRYYYAEAYPAQDWHNGPMLWLILKLLWDPSLSVEALVKEWCEAAVGKEAAVPLEAYFRAVSDYWEKSVPPTEYFQEKRQYLQFTSSGYLEPVTQEWLDARREELKKVVQLAAPYGKKRAEMFLNGFLKREPEISQYIKNNQLRKQAKNLKFKKVAEIDFNEKVGWVTWQSGSSMGTFSHAPGEGVGKTGAAAMDLKKSHKSMVYMRDFKAKPGAVYRISAQVKTTETDPTCTVGLRAAWSAPGKPWLNSAYEAQVTLNEDFSFDWRKLSVVVAAPQVENCKLKVLLSAGFSSKGNAYFDNVTVEMAE